MKALTRGNYSYFCRHWSRGMLDRIQSLYNGRISSLQCIHQIFINISSQFPAQAKNLRIIIIYPIINNPLYVDFIFKKKFIMKISAAFVTPVLLSLFSLAASETCVTFNVTLTSAGRPFNFSVVHGRFNTSHRVNDRKPLGSRRQCLYYRECRCHSVCASGISISITTTNLFVDCSLVLLYCD